MNFKRINKLLSAVMLFGIFQGLHAAPHHGDTFHLRQPDGSLVPVQVWGDEFYHDVESLEGYTLVRDSVTEWIHYAQVDAQSGDLVPTKVRYGSGKNPPHARKGLRADSSLAQQRRLANQRSLGYDKFLERVPRRAPRLPVTSQDAAPAPPASPEPRRVVGLTIIVNFPDQQSTMTRQGIDNFCNQVGYSVNGNQGSVYDYFRDVSGGRLLYNNIITDWITMDSNLTHYDQGPGFTKMNGFISEVLTKLQQQTNLDLSQLTVENNLAVALNILYAGSPTLGWNRGLWPHHSSYTGTVSVQGIHFKEYQIASIESGLTIGTFVHENGHMLMNWPDLYSYETPSHSNGVGNFCIMNSISERNPVQPNPYFRMTAGWIETEDISEATPGTQYFHEANSFSAYTFVRNEAEFYMIEARRRVGRSAALPAEGLAIWHIHTSGLNTRKMMGFPMVALVQADGLRQLEKKVNSGDTNDLFRASYNSRFNVSTSPAAKWHDSAAAGIDIAEISAVAPTMTFRIGPNAFIPTYALTVIDGEGSGSYTLGTVVTISAPASGTTGSFLRWTSSNVNLLDAYAQVTTVVMREVDGSARANYQIPQQLPGASTLDGAGYIEGVPRNSPPGTLHAGTTMDWTVHVTAPGWYRLRWPRDSTIAGSIILRNMTTGQNIDTLYTQGDGTSDVALDSGVFVWQVKGLSGTFNFSELEVESLWSVLVTASPFDLPGRIQAEAFHYFTEQENPLPQQGQDNQGLRLVPDQGFAVYRIQANPHTAPLKIRALSLSGASLVLRFNNGWKDTLNVPPSADWKEQSARSIQLNESMTLLEAEVIQGELELDWIDFSDQPALVVNKPAVVDLTVRWTSGAVNFVLPHDAFVQIILRTVRGNVVGIWNLGWLKSGSHTHALEPGLQLSAGVYRIHLQAENKSKSIPFVQFK